MSVLRRLLFRGNDGLTYWQRKRSARRWERGAGALPTAEETARLHERLIAQRARLAEREEGSHDD